MIVREDALILKKSTCKGLFKDHPLVLISKLADDYSGAEIEKFVKQIFIFYH